MRASNLITNVNYSNISKAILKVRKFEIDIETIKSKQ
jgi:hypothetical protein